MIRIIITALMSHAQSQEIILSSNDGLAATCVKGITALPHLVSFIKKRCNRNFCNILLYGDILIEDIYMHLVVVHKCIYTYTYTYIYIYSNIFNMRIVSNIWTPILFTYIAKLAMSQVLSAAKYWFSCESRGNLPRAPV